MIDIHAHPDHLTAMPYFKKRYGARTVTGSGMGIVLRAVRDIYNLGVDFPADGRQFDLLLGPEGNKPVQERKQNVDSMEYQPQGSIF